MRSCSSLGLDSFRAHHLADGEPLVVDFGGPGRGGGVEGDGGRDRGGEGLPGGTGVGAGVGDGDGEGEGGGGESGEGAWRRGTGSRLLLEVEAGEEGWVERDLDQSAPIRLAEGTPLLACGGIRGATALDRSLREGESLNDVLAEGDADEGELCTLLVTLVGDL